MLLRMLLSVKIDCGTILGIEIKALKDVEAGKRTTFENESQVVLLRKMCTILLLKNLIVEAGEH
jgi:hypothetical protein